MAPFLIQADLPQYIVYGIYLLIGISFGAVLEIAGFGNSPKLAAQFYFKDLTVLKVMFTAIITAMVLVFLTSALGLLNYDLVWVNPTYLWPGIVGGVIMGFGFILGGFCPGTSLVALATLKVDGLFFSLGALFGIFMFGETVSLFDEFWYSSFFGRVTLPQVFGLPTGVVVLLVVLMALFMFWGGEQLERIFGKRDLSKDPKFRYVGAGALVGIAVVIMILGQPTLKEKWQFVAQEKQPLLDNREVQIHPGELLEVMNDDTRNLVMLDLRNESDYNLFHIRDAKRVNPENILPVVDELVTLPPNSVIVLMSNDEELATDVWKKMTALSIVNLYILEGGINNWLDVFAHSNDDSTVPDSNGELRHDFDAALGSNQPAADPDAEHWHGTLEFERKVKLTQKVRRQGGCG